MSVLPDWNSESEQWLSDQNVEAKKLLGNPLLQQDIWRTIEDLHLEVNQHARVLSLNFRRIKQEWLKLLTKLYVLIRSKQNYSASYLRKEIDGVTYFSQFISTKFIFEVNQIDAKLFDEFEYYLKSLKTKTKQQPLAEGTRKRIYSSLTNLFNLCRQEGWIEVNTSWFKGKKKRGSHKNNPVEYIPEEVWQQLDDNLNYFPDFIQRMILVIRSTGLRIGELLNLPLGCLRKRGQQWRLRFLSEKYKVIDEIPICQELVVIIKEQQKYIQQNFGDTYNNLFNSGDGNGISYNLVPKIMSASTFNRWLKQLAEDQNICTKEGKRWEFSSHQFRKTVGTVMTNSGVRDLIIQKYLRHRSRDMQEYYKHLLEQVIGDEYQELMKETKYVNSTGKIVTAHKPNNPITELMRRKMYQITTQYGGCHRPILKSPCQTVNACWRCEHWLTSSNDLDALKDDLKKIEEELKTAKTLGLVRQQKGLVTDRKKLATRIQGLEVE